MGKKVKATKDGPYKVDGSVVIEDASGGTKKFKEDQAVWLCRCGASKNKPYCDGTHKKIGFKAEK
jgi:CDGSH-type Zn-finger protein